MADRWPHCTGNCEQCPTRAVCPKQPEPCPLPLDWPMLAVAAVIVLAALVVSSFYPWGFGAPLQ